MFCRSLLVLPTVLLVFVALADSIDAQDSSAAAAEPAAEETSAKAPAAQVARVPNQPAQPGLQNAPNGPPFQLSPVEQQFVDQILQMWEDESDKIQTFDCMFERWEYNQVFGPGGNVPATKSEGQLTYSKPDKGSFKINQIRHWTQQDPKQPGEYELQENEVGEHWVCDGEAIYEYNHEKKQLVVRPLPPELQGQAIVNGPLPFLFGADAEQLKQRYWIRSLQSKADTIWLEAWPRRQEDAAQYQRVDVMLERKTMMPSAIRVHMPNGQSSAVYMFKEPTVNGKLNQLFGSIFNAPRTPLGWKRVVEELPAGPQAAQPQKTQHR